MKRCFSIALILALLGTTAVSPSIAEEAEIVSEDVEAGVSEVIQMNAAEASITGAEVAREQTLAEAAGESLNDNSVTNADTATVNPEEPVSNPETATAITLNYSSLTIGIKEKFTGLAAVAVPDGALLPKVTWRSSKPKIVKVNAKTGSITGLKKGSATIYAKMDGSKKEVKCKVTVKAKPKKVNLNKTSMTLGVGITEQLKASVPKGYASGKFSFKSSSKKVASVDEYGLITARRAGSATITVTSYNGKKAKCKVTVMAEPASLAFQNAQMSIAVGQSSSVIATALAADGTATVATITYSIDEASPDAGCVTLDANTGAIMGVRKGAAIINAVTHNGVVASCVTEVDVGPQSVLLNNSSISIGVNEVYNGLLAELVAPDGAGSCAKSVSWSSSNTKIATVDAATGIVTGLKKGSCTIKVETPNGKSATCSVKVLKAPTSKTISIKPAVGSLNVGQSGKYTVTLTSGYGGSLYYTSDNPKVATIDSVGIVTAVAPGTAKITVTTYNGISKTAELVVNGNGSSGDDSKSGNTEKIDYLLKVAQSKLNKPYRYGSFGPNAFDCSGFAYWCYKQINITLRDSAKRQGYDTRYPQVAYGDLKPGDLVFFNTVDDDDLSDHTGIYMGNNKFIHCSSSAQKVIISTMASGYYKRNFSWGRRILN